MTTTAANSARQACMQVAVKYEWTSERMDEGKYDVFVFVPAREAELQGSIKKEEKWRYVNQVHSRSFLL